MCRKLQNPRHAFYLTLLWQKADTKQLLKAFTNEKANVSLLQVQKLTGAYLLLAFAKISSKAVSLNLTGDKYIKPDRVLTFFSSRANQHDVSKVVDQVN